MMIDDEIDWLACNIEVLADERHPRGKMKVTQSVFQDMFLKQSHTTLRNIVPYQLI